MLKKQEKQESSAYVKDEHHPFAIKKQSFFAPRNPSRHNNVRGTHIQRFQNPSASIQSWMKYSITQIFCNSILCVMFQSIGKTSSVHWVQ